MVKETAQLPHPAGTGSKRPLRGAKRTILLRLPRETARLPIGYPLIREQEDRYDETRLAAGIANLMHKQTRLTRAFRLMPVNGPSSRAPAA